MEKIVGLDLGGTFIKVGLVNKKGIILKKKEVPTGAEEGKKEVLSRMKEGVKFALQGVKEEVIGIGIGTPGLVDEKGKVFSAPNLPDWDDLPLKDIFEKDFSMPVVVENDVNSITYGEFIYGAGKGYKNIICITLGTGLGGGVIVNGNLLRGKYSAAELGHISIDYDGPRCNCGGIGCVERYIGAEYIVRRAKKDLRKNKSKITKIVQGDLSKITPKVIYQAAKAGDELSKKVWEKTGFYIGVMLADLVNIFNPEIIIIGGGIASAKEFLFPSIEKTIKERAYRLLTIGLKIVPAKLEKDIGILSAASLLYSGVRS